MIRIGGNSQETAVLVDQTSDSRVLEKDSSTSNDVCFSTLSSYKPSHRCFPVQTQTPYLVYTSELRWMPRNISSLVIDSILEFHPTTPPTFDQRLQIEQG